MKLKLNMPLAFALTTTLFILGCKKNENSSLLPKANFSFTGSNNAAIPDTLTFTNASQRGTSYKWVFGTSYTTTTTSTAAIKYVLTTYNGQPFNVTLVATNSYGADSVTKSVTLASTIITGVSGGSFPGGAATITGLNFTAGASNNQVTLNGVSATVVSATATTVTFIVPPNAGSGKLVLTTNGAAIPVQFTVYGLSVSASYFPGKLYFKHLGYNFISNLSPDFNEYIYGGNETDTLIVSNGSVSGAAGQFSGFQFSTLVQATPAVKIFGLTNNYEAASDYRIYKIGQPATVFAGNGSSGFADGQGTSAQFTAPFGVAADAGGNVYVTDLHRVRKITPAGLVSTLAGSGANGNADGQGTAATFGNLYGIAVDASGNVYVSDTEYHNIRKITAAGQVTTFAGSGAAGFADGAASVAQFFSPKGVAVDPLGDVFVSDSNYNNAAAPYTSAIRMINPLGAVTTMLSSAKGDIVNNPDGIVFGNFGIYICNTGSVTQPFLVGYYQQK